MSRLKDNSMYKINSNSSMNISMKYKTDDVYNGNKGWILCSNRCCDSSKYMSSMIWMFSVKDSMMCKINNKCSMNISVKYMKGKLFYMSRWNICGNSECNELYRLSSMKLLCMMKDKSMSVWNIYKHN